MHKIDARGLSCPEPVLQAKRGLEQNSEGIEIMVDNKVSVENVSRFAENSGYKVSVEESSEGFNLKINK